MPAQALTHIQAAAPISRRLSDQDLVINRDVFEALPMFYRCFTAVLIRRGEWAMKESGDAQGVA